MAKTPPVSGSPRTARVLDPSFVEHLDEGALADVRRRRDEAHAEREFQSYLRRLVQVRQDILRSERARRESGQEQAPLVERLTSVLSTGPTGTGRGEAMRVTLTDQDIVEAERRADLALEDVDLFHPEGLDDARLDEAMAQLDREERAISDARAAVIKVHDRLQSELMRRYREDPSLITNEA
jgi:hypothetical protein